MSLWIEIIQKKKKNSEFEVPSVAVGGYGFPGLVFLLVPGAGTLEARDTPAVLQSHSIGTVAALTAEIDASRRLHDARARLIAQRTAHHVHPPVLAIHR